MDYYITELTTRGIRSGKPNQNPVTPLGHQVMNVDQSMRICEFIGGGKGGGGVNYYVACRMFHSKAVIPLKRREFVL